MSDIERRYQDIQLRMMRARDAEAKLPSKPMLSSKLDPKKFRVKIKGKNTAKNGT